MLASAPPLLAQVNPAYEVATWRGFKPAAISYTFDDNATGQLPVALPLFDQYGFKTTLFTVAGWGANWAGLRTASANGHEVASHTVTHPILTTLTVAQQQVELQQSQATIRANVPTARCETIAYPNCVTGDLPTIQAYYLAGRVCSGQLIPATPTDFYNLSSIVTGTAGAVQTAAQFNAQAAAAKAAGSWCVFLIHGIDNDGGYSPTPAGELATHLAYVNTNGADFWVGTFSEVVKYIRERDALALTETAVGADLLRLSVRHSLSTTVYDVPVTLRRPLPATWPGAQLTRDGTVVPSRIVAVNGVSYLEFEAVPNQGDMLLAKSNALAASIPSLARTAPDLWPNPVVDNGTLAVKGAFTYAVYAPDGTLVASGRGTDAVQLGYGLPAGSYLVKITRRGQSGSTRFLKK